jgi:D-aspartate ligase
VAREMGHHDGIDHLPNALTSMAIRRGKGQASAMRVLRDGHRPPARRDRLGAVIVGGDYLGLGIARSLGCRGIPICVLDDERTITRFSRFTTYAVRVKDLRDEQASTEALLAIGSRLGVDGWVLFPTRDEIVASISKHRSELATVFRVPIPDWTTVRWASDKRKTYELARQLGIPAPRTWYPRSVADLERIDGDPPFAVKPAIKEHFIYATGAKAWRADTRSDLHRLFQRACQVTTRADEIMIQELIPGDGRFQFAFGAFIKDGKSLGSMVARRRRQHPPEFGRATTFAETVDVPVLQERSERLLRSIEYYGLAEVEYKLDPRDGEYKLLDFNARAWGYHTLGREAGVDFPLLLFEDQMGHPVAPHRARPGVRWIRLTTDLPTAAVEIWGGRLRLRDLLRTLAHEVDTEAVFSRDDPTPGVAEVALIPYLAWKRGF